MKAEQVKIMRRKLVRAINAHLKAGGTLITGSFGEHDSWLCPIGCLTHNVPNSNDECYAELASKKLGFNFRDDQMWSFIDGFDGNTLGVKKKDALYKLGAELRAKYIKEEV